MTTVTLRVPESMAERLTSAEMRDWLVDFLRRPHPLPPDPGSGEQRVSLTLSRGEVLQVAGSLRCSPSVALRRIAAERLGISSWVALNTRPVPAQASPSGTIPSWPPLITPRFVTATPRSNPPPPSKRELSAIKVLFAVLPGILFLVGLVFAVAGKQKQK
jgi:hypothetical protein